MYMYKVVVVTLKDGVSLRSEFIHKVPLYRFAVNNQERKPMGEKTIGRDKKEGTERH